MAYAAKDHVMDIGPKGLVSHTSSGKVFIDGKSREQKAKDRLKKYGQVISCYGESLCFHCIDAKEVILNLLVDDGSKSRGHRANFFNPDFNFMGSSTGEHKEFNQMTCIDYAAGYVPKGESDPIEKQMDIFLKEEVIFNNLPKDVVSWK